MAYRLNDQKYYNNRELSWLQFNYRVIQEAIDPNNPLLERLKFLAITSSNLDEFFMVRVAGLKDQVKMNYHEPDTKTQLTPGQQLKGIGELNRQNSRVQYEYYHKLTSELGKYNIYFKHPHELPKSIQEELEGIFDTEIYPSLTPLGIDAYRPFPKLKNKKINIFVNLSDDLGDQTAIVQLPTVIKRFYEMQDGINTYYVLTEDIIETYIEKLFKGYRIDRTFPFRITRNADLTIHEEGAADLLIEIERFLKERTKGAAVRLEIDISNDYTINGSFLRNELDLHEDDIYKFDGPLDLTFLFELSSKLKERLPNLVYQSFVPQEPKFLGSDNIYDKALREDIFFHHPFESFEPIVDFMKEAAEDPDVLAIKQTLYRVSSDSPIIEALKRAAENNKQVTVLVELKARFDEENNVQWAKELEDAGCHVIYGMHYLKTHSKITLVVKRVKGKIVRYVHLGTGNYNDSTAKQYTDMGIITTDSEIGTDAINFFNYLSGYSLKPEYNSLHVAPFEIRDLFGESIDEEIELHKEHGNGYIFAKMNSLTDKKVINKLLQASQEGVKVDLVIRGICCLKPGIEGVSDNIRVISIVGRFLEHSRIYYFNHNGEEKMYLSSADMMTRNMIKRVEILFPINDPRILEELKSVNRLYLTDNVKARVQKSDGTYEYVKNSYEPISAQDELMRRSESYGREQQVQKENQLLLKVKNRFKKRK
ncbi:RNA degradosome polyphosphate kinase [Salinicoccus halodurans]|uniref:Polyphosphate kinase n=1 Tax=Salinicoccus halodurans TaxID=407035 RepID=A0A0F7HKJ3_9STAP|nr:RNA degradosome polyphosphate kinase [Salinicoccus halodurans]AKG74446.1 polyphosphate kinase [Salinicoccus halodurans]SFK96113.1 polyphosphate kinase [Salinicoccus halodurans]